MEKQKINQLKSDYFTLQEFIKSTTAARLKINNTPSAEILRNLEYGVQMVLDPLRRIHQQPIIITSGYRCEKLNLNPGTAQAAQQKTQHAERERVIPEYSSAADIGKKPGVHAERHSGCARLHHGNGERGREHRKRFYAHDLRQQPRCIL